MSGLAVAGTAALAVIIVLAVLLLRSRRATARLRRQVEAAAGQLQTLQLSLGRFVPDEVIERVLAEGLTPHGERKEGTVLFADLVGFTALSEAVEPDVLVRILNGYFEHMSRAISDNRGRVSTFIGDGILALFGVHQPNPWQSDDAVRAALAMRDALRHYNRELEAEDLPSLKIGVGLHRGEGVAGLVGSSELVEFAFVGRTVNVAARLQELTRQYDADIIITDSLRRTLASSFRTRPLPPTPVKGVSAPLRIHAVDGAEARRE